MECGQKYSAFNADGTLKPKKQKYGALTKPVEKHDLAAQQAGSAGTLHCNPMYMDFSPESQMVFDPEPTMYGVKFSFTNDAARGSTSADGQLTDARYFWMDSR